MTDVELMIPVDAPRVRVSSAYAHVSTLGQGIGRYWRDALRRRMLAAADAVALLAVAVAAALLGYQGDALLFGALTPLWLVLAKLNGLYDRDHRVLRHLTVDELPALMVWALAGAATMTVLTAGLGIGGMTDARRLWFWLLLIALVAFLRAAARHLWRRLTPRERTLVIGDGALARAVCRKLRLFSDIHADVVAQITDARAILSQQLSLRGFDRIVLATDTLAEHDLAQLLPLCRRDQVKLSLAPPAHGTVGTATLLGHVAELAVLDYNTSDISHSTIVMKRVLDVVGAVLGLIIVSPLFALIAIATFVDSGRPLIFSQLRAGRHAKPFLMAKFRTMTRDAEARLADIVALDELDDPMFKLQRDPRVTRVGRLLRRTSLDELPQLWNVLRGEMSLVGPRPEQLELVDRYQPEHRFRLDLKPGMTGPMQVYGRGELTFQERLAVERDYVENLTLMRDLRILLLTLPVAIVGRGAY